MNIDQLIEKLQKIKAEHGNLYVSYVDNEYGPCCVDEVTIREADVSYEKMAIIR